VLQGAHRQGAAAVQEGGQARLLLPGASARAGLPGSAAFRGKVLMGDLSGKPLPMPAIKPAVQMFLDDLPIWGFVGKVEKILHTGETSLYKYYLFTHIHFEIRYNGAVQTRLKPVHNGSLWHWLVHVVRCHIVYSCRMRAPCLLNTPNDHSPCAPRRPGD
jgi:hypothetical protein